MQITARHETDGSLHEREGTAKRKGDREVSRRRRRRHIGLHRNISLEGNTHNDGPCLLRHDGKGEEAGRSQKGGEVSRNVEHERTQERQSRIRILERSAATS